MVRPPIEVADVIEAHGAEFVRACGPVSPARLRLMRDLIACRTAALGGHVQRCSNCGFEQISYNSCRNRHCPKCQAKASAEWFEKRQVDLLPVEYFHVVFTLPEEVAAIALQNKRELYGLLFAASAETLKQIAADPKHLGAEIGFTSVLHTWGQNLHHHPHVHCVVPGGGLSADGERWVSCPRGFFLPVRVLSAVFRGKFLAGLRSAYAQGRLTFQGSLSPLADPETFRALVLRMGAEPWVVYAKPPFGGPEQVLKYLARYTHRVAISNRRLVSLEHGQVRFRWKDYRHGRRQRTMVLPAVEFIRRFLQHVLPRRFPRIRHIGFLSNRCRKTKLNRCRELLHAETRVDHEGPMTSETHDTTCPKCGKPTMYRAGKVKPVPAREISPANLDTS